MHFEDAGFDVVARLLAALSPTERERCVVYADMHRRPAAEPSGTEPGLDAPHWLAFADLRPGANWMHPALWLAVPVAAGDVRRVATDRPPTFGPLPSGWRVVWQSPGIEPWQCLALADAPSPP